MKSKRKKPTVKELTEDLQTVYKVVASQLAKFMEAKTEKMKDETQRDAVLEKDEATP